MNCLLVTIDPVGTKHQLNFGEYAKDSTEVSVLQPGDLKKGNHILVISRLPDQCTTGIVTDEMRKAVDDCAKSPDLVLNNDVQKLKDRFKL